MSAPVSGWTIVERRGREGLVYLEADWRRLYAASADRSSYLAYGAHLAYVDNLMVEPDRLRCLALERDGEVRAICLLEPKTDRILGVPLRVWGMTTPPHMPLPDVLCPDDADRRRFLPAVAGHLRRQRERLPLLVVGSLPRESAVWMGLSQLEESGVVVASTGSFCVVDCDRSVEAVTAGLGRGFRSKMRRCRRAFEALPGARFETAAEETALTEAFEVFLDVEASGWKGARGTRTALAFREGQPGFFREVLRARDGDDHCEVNLLHADGGCIAASVCMRTGPELAILKVGYDEGYSQLKPGHLLLSYELERWCADDGLRRLNFVSNEDWEHHWRPTVVQLQKAYVALDPVVGLAVLGLLRLRVGPGRRLARWARARRTEVLAWWAGRRSPA